MFQRKKGNCSNSKQDERLAIFTGSGVVIGIAIGIAMDNIAIGMSLGIVIGAGIGISLRDK